MCLDYVERHVLQLSCLADFGHVRVLAFLAAIIFHFTFDQKFSTFSFVLRQYRPHFEAETEFRSSEHLVSTANSTNTYKKLNADPRLKTIYHNLPLLSN